MSLNESTTLPISIINKKLQWTKNDTMWMLSLYGTAIGAGTLFLPIDAGINGIWPLLIMALLAFPMTYFSHRALCRFVLSSAYAHTNITDVSEEHFGTVSGRILTALYFFAIYPILLMYSVAITNTMRSFLLHQLGITPPPRALLSLILLLILMTIIRFGQEIIVKSMSLLVYPFAASLVFLSLYLVPNWNSAMLVQPLPTSGAHGLICTLWLAIPVMVFAFNHSPIISSFAVQQKLRHGVLADEKSSTIMQYSDLMMVFSVFFFVFSCVLSLSPHDLLQAKQQNISILSYLANHFKTPIVAYLAPLIAFIAIAKSFFGHYLGALEGLSSIIDKCATNKALCKKKLQLFIEVFILISCWVTATINPNILHVIETLGGPVIAILLFLMPMYAIAMVPAMRKYQADRWSNLFTVLIGLITLSAVIYNLI